MSYKTALNYYKKYLTEKKNPAMIYSKSKNISLKLDSNLLPPKQLNLLSITYNNLKKYSTSKRKYNILIVNSIVFDLRIHKVAVFKNNLLWDESSEFLKRFYNKSESTERIPKISEYYEKYTLFPPVYFGLEGLILIIMNKWTKRKKSYLEYIEDHEEEREKRKKEIKILSFEPLISPSLISNKASSKSIISKNTLDLSKFENEPNKNIININNNINNYNKTIYTNNKDKKKENNKSISFSEIIDDLSSQYSIIINNDMNNNTKNDENDKKFRKIQKKTNKKNLKKERRNEINTSKLNTYYYNTCNNSKINNTTHSSKIKTIDSSGKNIKISFNNKDNKYILINNNNNLIKRNKNNFPLPIEIKKYQRKVMNTQNNSKKSTNFPNNFIFCKKKTIQGTIRVNTISNVIEKNKIFKDNNNIEKEENHSSKKLGSNFIKNNPQKNPINNIKKKNSHNAIKSGTSLNSKEKTLNNKNYNLSKILKLKSLGQIKRKSPSEISNIFQVLKISKPLTSRNYKNQQLFHIKEKISATHLKTNQISINDENKEIYNKKKIKDNETKQKTNPKILLEDPFLYKLTQLTKKKPISFTTANSLSRSKNDQNFFHYGMSSTIENNNINSNIIKYNTNNLSNKKNLVLTKLNSKKHFIYNKNKFLGEDNAVGSKSASIHKNDNKSISITNSRDMNSNKKNNNSKNINLNLNLNINLNIDMNNKNKGKKILLNQTIINQLRDKINKNNKFSNVIKNNNMSHQYSLTSRNSLSHLNDFSKSNKCEYTILKKLKKI